MLKNLFVLLRAFVVGFAVVWFTPYFGVVYEAIHGPQSLAPVAIGLLAYGGVLLLLPKTHWVYRVLYSAAAYVLGSVAVFLLARFLWTFDWQFDWQAAFDVRSWADLESLQRPSIFDWAVVASSAVGFSLAHRVLLHAEVLAWSPDFVSMQVPSVTAPMTELKRAAEQYVDWSGLVVDALASNGHDPDDDIWDDDSAYSSSNLGVNPGGGIPMMGDPTMDVGYDPFEIDSDDLCDSSAFDDSFGER